VPGGSTNERPFDRLRVLAVQEKQVTPTMRHVEIYSMDGLLTLLWHGPPDAGDVVLLGGGAMGGLLGPAEGLYTTSPRRSPRAASARSGSGIGARTTSSPARTTSASPPISRIATAPRASP
jgi:hypothetical protein